ncbi:MAG: fibronectin type III domain-containing protein [Nocardioides sp.]
MPRDRVRRQLGRDGPLTGLVLGADPVRLGWAGRVARVRHDGTYTVADIEHAHSAYQALRIRAGRTTYWVEYQRQHSPVVGRTIPGVMIRRQIGHGPVEMSTPRPGNPTGIVFPDADLTDPALPVGSSLTTPQGIRFTTVATGRRARVEVRFDEKAAVPDAPQVTVRPSGSGYRVSWTSPPDNGQIVLGYRVTTWVQAQTPTGTSTYVTSPAGYRRSIVVPADKDATGPPTVTVKALNQVGWSPLSDAVTPGASGPQVTVTSPISWDLVGHTFTVDVAGAPAQRTGAPPAMAWAEVGSDGVVVPCTTESGPGPYSLTCDDSRSQLSGTQLLTVHVQDSGDNVATATFPVQVSSP